MKRLVFLFALIFFLSLTAFFSGPEEYMIGDNVKDFTLRDAITNNDISLFEQTEKKGVALIFSSPSCPYSKIYDNRIIKLAKKYQKEGVAFILINPSDSPQEDSYEKMSEWAKKQSYSFPFLKDLDMKVATQFGASKLPEAFLLKNMKGNFVLQYKGAIDDNPQVERDVKNKYLENAINNMLANETVRLPEKRATGCLIR